MRRTILLICIPLVGACNQENVDRKLGDIDTKCREKSRYGDGSSLNPWIICTVEDFKKVSDDLTAFYEIQTDLNFKGEHIHPIGSEENPFVGSLNGKGHRLDNFFIAKEISMDAHESIGLFGAIGNGGYVGDVRLSNVRVIGRGYIGSIAGINSGTIESVRVDNSEIIAATASAHHNYGHSLVGGIAGVNNGLLFQVSASLILDVGGGNSGHIGGICGVNSDTGRIEQSVFLNAKVKSTSAAFGAICSAHYGFIGDSFTHSVDLSLQAGNTIMGLVAITSPTSEIERSYISLVSGITALTCGKAYPTCLHEGLGGLSSAAMKSSPYHYQMAGFNFGQVWIQEYAELPHLIWMND